MARNPRAHSVRLESARRNVPVKSASPARAFPVERNRERFRSIGNRSSVCDPAEDLTSAEAIAIFLTEAFKTEDAGYIAHALGVVARARGMADIASRTGPSRGQLYRSFSAAGNPRLRTILAIISALGVELSARPPARRSRSQHHGKRAA